jgi:hypothetical protein
MSDNFLPQFRRQLFDWLQYRVASGRLPFRRVEESPPVLTDKGTLTPDLVLWINRDSLLAGAMILIPSKTDPGILQDGCAMAGGLGLRQFVTWEARAVNLWETGTPTVQPVKSWALPAERVISADDFAVIFEQLLQELKQLAVSAVLSPGQLPPAYFANLCLQTLRDIEPALQESARLTARIGQTDQCILRRSCDKAWLTLWQLLALLQHDRLPQGIRPERLDRALGYALADFDQQGGQHLACAPDEAPLAEGAAIRFHHLAGRLVQLGWHHCPERTTAAMAMLSVETAKAYHIDTAEPDFPPTASTLFINHLPLRPPTGSLLVAPQPCLAAWELTVATGDGIPAARTFTSVVDLPADTRPTRLVATFVDTPQLPAAQRRSRLTALRQPWPYRRFQLPAEAPAWLWDVLHLSGLVDPEGELRLTLPAGWPTAPGSELLWSLLTERSALTHLQVQTDGRQTLMLVGHERAPDTITIGLADGTTRQVPSLEDDAAPITVAALATGAQKVGPPALRSRRKQPALAEKIAAKVFRDGLPCFPEHYLRRIDRPPLRTYLVPGPLQIVSHFFDHVQLTGPDGTSLDSDNPVDAEALVLASRDGRARIELPTDPAITLRLTVAYRNDLRRLWQELLDECHRHYPVQRKATAMAKRLWREHNLPPAEDH